MDLEETSSLADSDAESFNYSLEISGENLEDLLAYDDLFLDYFNAFLALPVFPQALYYNRLTGAFEETDEVTPDLNGSLSSLNPHSLHYAPTDQERENMLEWARQERLPMFLRTQLFRELKLVKLLLRPLEDRPSVSRGSGSNVRGYSRQTETYVSSLSNSVDNSGHEGLAEDEELWGELRYSALYPYTRPGSRALSMPIKCLHDDSSVYEEEGEDYYYIDLDGESPGRQRPVKAQRTSTASRSVATTRTATLKRAARISNKVEVIPTTAASKSGKTRSSQRTKGPPASSTEEAFKMGARALSAPVTYAHFLKMQPVELPDFDAMFGEVEPEPTGQAYVTFEDDHVSEEQTENDVRNLEGRFMMSLQQMKEYILATRGGFEQFREFIKDTSGAVLLDFWLDCECFKDTMEDFDENKQREIASMLYRDIQDKYKLRLTQDAKEQITRSTSNMGLSHTIFLRTQYDVLRRLRAYWLPRYITHCERTNAFADWQEQRVPELPGPKDVRTLKAVSRSQSSLFPTISLVHSMPVLPEEAKDFSFSGSQGNVVRATSSLSLRSSQTNVSFTRPWRRTTVTSKSLSARNGQTPVSAVSTRSTKQRFTLSLALDRAAGGPFQRFLARRLGDEQLLACLLFWQDVTEYGASEDRSADRLLRLCHAWAIYNKFLSEDAPHKVEYSADNRLHLYKSLQSARDFVEAAVFASAKNEAVNRLEKAWIRYLKEDLKMFLDCRVRVGGDSPPSTAEAIEITVTDQDVLITRPRPWIRRVPGSGATERARRLQTALILAEDIDEERREQKKQEALERRKEMERERRKAIKAAYARQREAKKKKPGATSAKTTKIGEGEGRGGEGEDKTKLTFQELAGNKQVMALFSKHVADPETPKETQNALQLLQELETYFNIKDHKQKKDSVVAHIFKTYLDPQGKKYIQTNDGIAQMLLSEKERPKSATLREILSFLQPKVDEAFQNFITKQSEEMGVTASDLVSMSQSELALRMSSDSSLYNNAWPKGSKGHGRGKGDSQGTASGLVSREGGGAGGGLILSSARGLDSSLNIPLGSSFRLKPGKRGKTSGRAQPSREDKNEFLNALGQSSAGQPTIPMLYFYKYLLKHAQDDGMPLLDKDLFFYIEVQKFKDCSHAFSDEEMLKRKVQSIVDCFLESVYLPALQINVTSEVHSKAMKAAQRYLGGKEVLPSLFDEAQLFVFKELLPYWAGFRKSQQVPVNAKRRPVTKYEKMLKKRLENIENYQIPSRDFVLPRIPEGAIPSYTITLSDGVKFREASPSEAGTPTPAAAEARDQRGSRATVTSSLAENPSRKSRKLSLKEPVTAR